MKYLLDTNACIVYLSGRSPLLLQRMQATQANQIAVCAVVKAEMFYGALKSQHPQQTLASHQRFFNQFVSFPFDDAAALIYGEIRADLARKGMPIGPYDLQIAAIALANGLTLVTHNTNEFSRIPNLLWEDWES